MPAAKRLSALLAVAAAVTLAAGCGSNDIKGTIPADQAAELNADLDAVQSNVAANQCALAADAADRFVDAVNALPADSGVELKNALRDAGTNLKSLAACQSGATGASGVQPSDSSTASTDASSAETTTTTTQSEPAPQPSPPGDQGSGGDGQGSGTDQGAGDESGNGQGTGTGSGQAGGDTGGGSSGGTGGTGVGNG